MHSDRSDPQAKDRRRRCIEANAPALSSIATKLRDKCPGQCPLTSLLPLPRPASRASTIA
jgi:hypothetical protein